MDIVAYHAIVAGELIPAPTWFLTPQGRGVDRAKA